MKPPRAKPHLHLSEPGAGRKQMEPTQEPSGTTPGTKENINSLASLGICLWTRRLQEPSGANPGTKQNINFSTNCCTFFKVGACRNQAEPTLEPSKASIFVQVFERFCGIGACRNQVEPTLEPSKSLDLSTFHCWTPSRNQVEPSQEPRQMFIFIAIFYDFGCTAGLLL